MLFYPLSFILTTNCRSPIPLRTPESSSSTFCRVTAYTSWRRSPHTFDHFWSSRCLSYQVRAMNPFDAKQTVIYSFLFQIIVYYLLCFSLEAFRFHLRWEAFKYLDGSYLLAILFILVQLANFSTKYILRASQPAKNVPLNVCRPHSILKWRSTFMLVAIIHLYSFGGGPAVGYSVFTISKTDKIMRKFCCHLDGWKYSSYFGRGLRLK